MNKSEATLYYTELRQAYEDAYRSHDLNLSGWNSSKGQSEAYSLFLQAIDRPGTILDLGCGDGMLLRYLIDNSELHLVPFGVDFLPRSIQQAKICVLPQWQKHFFVSNVNSVEFYDLAFDFVITSTDYVASHERSEYVQKLLGLTKSDGCLLLYDYIGSGVFDEFVERINDIGLRPSRFLTSEFSKIAIIKRS